METSRIEIKKEVNKITKQSKEEILKEKIVNMIKEFVTKEGTLSLKDIILALEEAKNALHLVPISFSLKGQ